MKKYALLFKLIPITFVLSLSACHEDPDNIQMFAYKKPPHATFVETEDINWGMTDEEDQEFADEI